MNGLALIDVLFIPENKIKPEMDIKEKKTIDFEYLKLWFYNCGKKELDNIASHLLIFITENISFHHLPLFEFWL